MPLMGLFMSEHGSKYALLGILRSDLRVMNSRQVELRDSPICPRLRLDHKEMCVDLMHPIRLILMEWTKLDRYSGQFFPEITDCFNFLLQSVYELGTSQFYIDPARQYRCHQ